MEENSADNTPLFYRELPKERQRELQQEYFQTAEAKKMKKRLILVVVIFAVVVIASAVIGVWTGHASAFTTTPTFLICIWPAILSQTKFEKWLEAEKNILMKRKK
ncbi:MAG: hypothetical protein FWG28_07290 [Clostridiales bacterium]|nr:hypothetical protein [Clostridiales bacterium]